MKNLRICKQATDYGRGPHVWMIGHGFNKWVHLSEALCHPVWTFKYLFLGWTKDHG